MAYKKKIEVNKFVAEALPTTEVVTREEPKGTPSFVDLFSGCGGLGLIEPKTFKVGRAAIFQLAKVNRDLFTDQEERESGNYIVHGLKGVTPFDFAALTLAFAQILSNQSHQSGNDDINSGLSRKVAEKATEQTGREMYSGQIVATLNDICRKAYGEEPTTKQKKKIASLIQTLDQNSVKIENKDYVIENKICSIMEKATRKKDGAIAYALYLNPIFSEEIRKNFGELPQDITKRLCEKTKKRSEAHYLLLLWLCTQKKSSPHTLTVDVLLQKLMMEEWYKKDKGRTEQQLLSICKTMVEIEVLSSFEPEYYSVKGRQRIRAITFYLNPNFVRRSKKIEGK